MTAWGALGGVLLSLVPAALVTLGLGTPRGGWLGLWQFTGVIIGRYAFERRLGRRLAPAGETNRGRALELRAA